MLLSTQKTVLLLLMKEGINYSIIFFGERQRNFFKLVDITKSIYFYLMKFILL